MVAVVYARLVDKGGPAHQPSLSFKDHDSLETHPPEFERDLATVETAANNSCVHHRMTELEPQDKTKSGADCDGKTSRPINVIIAPTSQQAGRPIYNRTATCGEWHDTDRTFTIEQAGDEFMVTDGMSRE